MIVNCRAGAVAQSRALSKCYRRLGRVTSERYGISRNPFGQIQMGIAILYCNSERSCVQEHLSAPFNQAKERNDDPWSTSVWLEKS